MSQFGPYIKAQREARGWSLREASLKIKTSSSRLKEVERGKSYHTDHATKPSRELVQRIATAYDLPKDVLLAQAGYEAGPLTELSQEALKLIGLFETLPADRKELALGIISLLASRAAT